jgi:hypothetical protein
MNVLGDFLRYLWRISTAHNDRSDGQKGQRQWEAMGGRRWEAIAMSMTGGPYALNRIPSPLKLRGEAMPNKGWLIVFLYFFFLIKGIKVTL